MKAINSKSILIILAVISLQVFSQNQPGVDQTESPYFFILSEDAAVDQMPLQLTSAYVSIAGVIADVVVTQTYKNNGKTPLEAIYVFPGSTRSAVYAMQMKIGERTIVAKIEEKQKARQQYEEAKAEGKTASLLEQQRPNVFQMNVSNILPGDIIKVELRYSELLVPEEGVYEFVYPTVVGPRYSNSPATDVLPKDKWVSNPYTHEGELPLYNFDIEVDIDAGMPLSDVVCESHPVDIIFSGKAEAEIGLKEGSENTGNKDFILKYKLKGNKIETGLLLYEGEEENFFLAMIQPPKTLKPEMIPPREYIFIVDVSGSMTGYPLDVSKKLLKDLINGLKPEDQFNILLFAGGSSVFSQQSVKANSSNVSRAISFLENQRGGGGTELLPALKRALKMPTSDQYARSFIIATDGYVSVEKEAFELIRDNLGNANFFPFGIGSSVNRFIIEGMAHVGKGTPFVATTQADALAVAEKFRRYIQFPALTNIKLSFEGFNAYDIEPTQVHDVFADRPVLVFGKYRGTPKGRLIVTGYAGNTGIKTDLEISKVKSKKQNRALRYLWARERIRILDDFASIGDEGGKEDILELSLKYNLLTRYTSFIAIDSEVRNADGQSTTVTQPLPLPEGVSDYAVGMAAQAPRGGAWKKGGSNHSVQCAELEIMPDAGFSGNEIFSKDEDDEKAEVFTIVEIMPEYQGGTDDLFRFLEDQMHSTYKLSLTGSITKVLVSFTVRKDGSVADIQVKNTVSKELRKEAIRLIKLTSGMWNAGMQRGKKVQVTMNIPIEFRL
jgi:Ca-activated chloride channel family protein